MTADACARCGVNEPLEHHSMGLCAECDPCSRCGVPRKPATTSPE